MRRGQHGSGFTLVELLVGVTILAIIVIPIATAFLSSQNATNRAREIRNQTLAAHNVIETYKASDINTLVDQFKENQATMTLGTATVSSIAVKNAGGGYDPVTPTSTETASASGYRVYLTGADAGSRLYDAVLSIDASQFTAANSAPIVDYKIMDALYTQPDPAGADQNNNPDISAAKAFAAQAQIDSGNAVLYTYFTDRMPRKVTVTIRKIASGGQTGVISCTALFHYDASYTYSLTDNTKVPPLVTTYTKSYATEYSYDFYSGNYTATSNGINGLYLFYYPNSTAQSDTIEILNRDNVTLSIYLIRQSTVDVAYTPTINLRETYVSGTEPQHAVLHYNNVTVPQYPYRYYAGYLSNGVYNDFWYSWKYFDGILVDTPAKNRLYGVKVELFKAGTNFSGTPLSSFDASALN